MQKIDPNTNTSISIYTYMQNMCPIVGLSEETTGRGKEKKMIVNNIEIHYRCIVGTRHNKMH
jgi:hypothetical protein